MANGGLWAEISEFMAAFEAFCAKERASRKSPEWKRLQEAVVPLQLRNNRVQGLLAQLRAEGVEGVEE